MDADAMICAREVLRDIGIPWADDWEKFFSLYLHFVPDQLMEPVEYQASAVSSIWKYDPETDTAILNAKLLDGRGNLFYRSLLETSAYRWAHVRYYAIASNYVIEDCDDELERAHRRQEILDALKSKLRKGHAKENILAEYVRHHPWEFQWLDPSVNFIWKSHKLARQNMTKEIL
jgi:hypothetical protein